MKDSYTLQIRTLDPFKIGSENVYQQQQKLRKYTLGVLKYTISKVYKIVLQSFGLTKT